MRVFLRHVATVVLPYTAGGALLIYLLMRHRGDANALYFAVTYGTSFGLSGLVFSLGKLRKQSNEPSQ
jgi:hypothetical protein